ncbi:hypothetical protein Bca101_025771 [Brassica carinata]
MEGSKKMMKHPMKEVYGSDAAEDFSRGKKETEEHHRSLLRLANEHRQSENEWNQSSSKVTYFAAQIDLLRKLVKVKVPDWFKLGEKWMID